MCKIYGLYTADDTLMYIGATRGYLCWRMRFHRQIDKKSGCPLVKEYLRQHGLQSLSCRLIRSCASAAEMFKLEKELIQEFTPLLNVKSVKSRSKFTSQTGEVDDFIREEWAPPSKY